MKYVEFNNGMTVKELKDLIKDWPESNAYNGEPTEVWIGHAGLSSACKSASPLNMRDDDGGQSADIIFECEEAAQSIRLDGNNEKNRKLPKEADVFINDFSITISQNNSHVFLTFEQLQEIIKRINESD